MASWRSMTFPRAAGGGTQPRNADHVAGLGGLELRIEGGEDMCRASAGPARPPVGVDLLPAKSHVEAELHDVAVLHDVVLALHAHPAVRSRLGHRAGLHE